MLLQVRLDRYIAFDNEFDVSSLRCIGIDLAESSQRMDLSNTNTGTSLWLDENAPARLKMLQINHNRHNLSGSRSLGACMIL